MLAHSDVIAGRPREAQPEELCSIMAHYREEQECVCEMVCYLHCEEKICSHCSYFMGNQLPFGSWSPHDEQISFRVKTWVLVMVRLR